MRRIEVPVELLEAAVLVPEHASSAVHALLRLVESATVLALKLFIVAVDCSHSELFLAMSEATLVLVAALCSLDPVLAQLCLVLSVLIELHGHCLTIATKVTHVTLMATVLWRVRRSVCFERGLLAREESLTMVHHGCRSHSKGLKMCGLEGRLWGRWDKDGGLEISLGDELCDACLERRHLRRARAERGAPNRR